VVSSARARGWRLAVYGVRFAGNGSRLALTLGETPPARRVPRLPCSPSVRPEPVAVDLPATAGLHPPPGGQRPSRVSVSTARQGLHHAAPLHAGEQRSSRVEFTGAERALVVEQQGYLKLPGGGYHIACPMPAVRFRSQHGQLWTTGLACQMGGDGRPTACGSRPAAWGFWLRRSRLAGRNWVCRRSCPAGNALSAIHGR